MLPQYFCRILHFIRSTINYYNNNINVRNGKIQDLEFSIFLNNRLYGKNSKLILDTPKNTLDPHFFTNC